MQEQIRGRERTAGAIGVDTGEGAAETSLAVVDELGLIELQAKRTKDTSEIPGWVLAFARQHRVPPEKIMFDQGGGGLEHAWLLRRQGYNVQTVAFGATVSAPIKPRGVVQVVGQRKELAEERYVYKNRRAEMYHMLRLRLQTGFALPKEYVELRRQLAPVPLLYDGEGRIWLPPKTSKTGDEDEDTMMKRIGCSPDESDSLVLAVYGMSVKTTQFKVRAFA